MAELDDIWFKQILGNEFYSIIRNKKDQVQVQEQEQVQVQERAGLPAGMQVQVHEQACRPFVTVMKSI